MVLLFTNVINLFEKTNFGAFLKYLLMQGGRLLII